MKKLLLLSLFSIFLANDARTQNWFSADHRWVFHISGGFAGFNFDMEMFAESDTIIQNRACRKWAFHSNGIYTLTPRYTFSDGPRAFYFDTVLDSFVKIYDFSLPVGSLVQIPRIFGTFIYQIDSVDVVQAGDLTLKRQRAHYVSQTGPPSDWKFDILENAGMVGLPFELGYPNCSFVLIPDFECASIVDGIDISFLCFSTPTGSFNPFSGTCMVVGTRGPEYEAFNIVPNPAGDFIEIQGNRAVVQAITLTDMGGKALRHWEGLQPNYELQGIPAGMYFLEVILEDGARAAKKLIKR